MRQLLFVFACIFVLTTSAESKKAAVFVDKFVPNGDCKVDASGIQILHDRIVGNVVSSRKYEVVERENLAKVQKELKLVDAGLTEGSAPESNKLKAAGYCVYGKVLQYRSNMYQTKVGDLTVTRADGIVELQLRITNIENGKLLAAKTILKKVSDNISNTVGTTKDPKREALVKAVDQAAKEVVIKLNDVAFPVYVLSINSKFVTANISAEQVTEGDVWEAFELGDELTDPQTGETIGRDEELVGKVRVSRPGAKTTKFEPLTEKDMKDIRQSWDDARSDAEASGNRSRAVMVLHKAPDSAASGKAASAKMPDMSAW